MNPLTIGVLSFGFIFSGTLLGFYLGKRLPKTHLSSESKETVKTAWGMVATMSALVLGLLVGSAKSSFDAVGTERTRAAAQIVMLDHLLVRYGPQADAARSELRQVVAAEIEKDARERAKDASATASTALQNANGLEQLEDALTGLSPSSDDQRALLTEAKKICGDLFLGRVLVIEHSHTALPNALLLALVGWLTMLFIGISLFAPRNQTVVVTLLVCCLSLSFAIFLINDLNQPLHGLVNVSDAPMREALEFLSGH